MFGLMKKDLLMLKSNFKLWLVLIFIYGAMAYQGQMSLMFLLPFMSIVIMISTFSYDTFNKWDAYACTLPSGRKNSVRAKYLATLIIITLTITVITIISLLITFSQSKTVDPSSLLIEILSAVFATTLIESLMYPAIYKLGVEKARVGVFILIVAVALIGSILSKIINFKPILTKLSILNNYWFLILSVLIILMLFFSYKISLHISSKKEY